MKNSIKVALLAIGIIVALSGRSAMAVPTTYILTITNGSTMPISPIAVYAQNGQTRKTKVGAAASMGFVQLCQMGNPMTRIQELGMDSDVTFKTQTSGMLLPGESKVVEIDVNDPLQQSINFETMYGKTKDICAVATIGSHSLYALKQHVTSAVLGKDDVVQTGAFLDPTIPMGQTYLDPNVCMGATDAITCLRSLALSSPNSGKIRSFAGYLSSVNMLLEKRYDAEQTLSLMIPTSGAVHYELKLKH